MGIARKCLKNPKKMLKIFHSVPNQQMLQLPARDIFPTCCNVQNCLGYPKVILRICDGWCDDVLRQDVRRDKRRLDALGLKLHESWEYSTCNSVAFTPARCLALGRRTILLHGHFYFILYRHNHLFIY